MLHQSEHTIHSVGMICFNMNRPKNKILKKILISIGSCTQIPVQLFMHVKHKEPIENITSCALESKQKKW